MQGTRPNDGKYESEPEGLMPPPLSKYPHPRHEDEHDEGERDERDERHDGDNDRTGRVLQQQCDLVKRSELLGEESLGPAVLIGGVGPHEVGGQEQVPDPVHDEDYGADLVGEDEMDSTEDWVRKWCWTCAMLPCMC